ncbi:MAG: HAD family hydrolase [Candidatus Paceibacterota bacterium]
MQTRYGGIDAVLFDVSGVLIDDMRAVYETNMRTIEAHGQKRITFEEWQRMQPITLKKLLEKLGVIMEQEEINRDFERVFLEVRKDPRFDLTLIDGAVEALAKLERSGIKLFVVSAHAKGTLELELARLGIRNFFADVIGGTSQDKATAIKKLLRSNNLDPKRVIFIGDTIHDLISGKIAGVKTAAVSTGYNTHETLIAQNPTISVSRSLDEFLKELGID